LAFWFGRRKGHPEKHHYSVSPLDNNVKHLYKYKHRILVILIALLIPMDDAVNVEDIEGSESIFIGLATLGSATNNFDEKNKLGEGGFGAVYKVDLFPLQIV
jgi:hypothetical protein